MDPTYEEEILNVSFLTRRNKADRNEPWFSFALDAITLRPRPCFALLSPTKKREFLHAAAVMAIVPARKTHEGHVLVGISNTLPRVAVLRRKSEMTHREPSLKSFFANQPVRRTFLFRVRSPCIETCSHK